jgi:hypothetical protein
MAVMFSQAHIDQQSGHPTAPTHIDPTHIDPRLTRCAMLDNPAMLDNSNDKPSVSLAAVTNRHVPRGIRKQAACAIFPRDGACEWLQ